MWRWLAPASKAVAAGYQLALPREKPLEQLLEHAAHPRRSLADLFVRQRVLADARRRGS